MKNMAVHRGSASSGYCVTVISVLLVFAVIGGHGKPQGEREQMVSNDEIQDLSQQPQHNDYPADESQHQPFNMNQQMQLPDSIPVHQNNEGSILEDNQHAAGNELQDPVPPQDSGPTPDGAFVDGNQPVLQSELSNSAGADPLINPEAQANSAAQIPMELDGLNDPSTPHPLTAVTHFSSTPDQQKLPSFVDQNQLSEKTSLRPVGTDVIVSTAPTTLRVDDATVSSPATPVTEHELNPAGVARDLGMPEEVLAATSTALPISPEHSTVVPNEVTAKTTKTGEQPLNHQQYLPTLARNQDAPADIPLEAISFSGRKKTPVEGIHSLLKSNKPWAESKVDGKGKVLGAAIQRQLETTSQEPEFATLQAAPPAALPHEDMADVDISAPNNQDAQVAHEVMENYMNAPEQMQEQPFASEEILQQQQKSSPYGQLDEMVQQEEMQDAPMAGPMDEDYPQSPLNQQQPPMVDENIFQHGEQYVDSAPQDDMEEEAAPPPPPVTQPLRRRRINAFKHQPGHSRQQIIPGRRRVVKRVKSIHTAAPTTTEAPEELTTEKVDPVWVERAARRMGDCHMAAWCNPGGMMSNDREINTQWDRGVPVNLLPRYGRIGF